ncbi:MAG: circularly permuted type 2 ATP-grasp protein [Cellvibrionaceae bacterium]
MSSFKQSQSSTSGSPAGFTQGYQSIQGTWDESLGPTGEVREHWAYLLNSLDTLGPQNLTQRQIKSQRILRDDGATYKPYTDQERTWELDPVPLLLDTTTWQGIEAGLLQRTTLFDKLLKDIYGKQDLVHQGIFPPEALFANPGFLRPCFGIEPPSEQALVLHAVDMVRTPDNQVCIIGDRTQSPSGAGYALENRTVMSRVFPSLFRESQVRRLALFFQSLRYKLNSLSPSDELPNIVVLTPGSRSESYFEHAYLANYLGYSLVQGRDLVVRNGYVWTKSLNGLSRVDVILRRVDDYYCDPAELKSDSYLGVPGLLESIRAGKVVVTNPLGSGVLESPIFLKYLPAISQELLGEELLLNSAKTYWAYDPSDRDYMLDNIQSLIIKPIYKKHNQQSVLGHECTPEQLKHLQQQIRENPLKFVGQEYVQPSYAPSWKDEQFIARPTVLRSFVVGIEGAGTEKISSQTLSSDYSVMPGGLTRMGRSPNDKIITNQLAALSKDTWILSDEPERYVSLWSDKSDHVSISEEEQNDLPSRVVENMFWLGRYAVRAEFALRLLRTVFVQLNNTQHLSKESYRTILLAVTQVTETFPGFNTVDSVLFENPEAELISIIIDANRRGSIVSRLNEMLNCAEEVKVLLSADTQRVINDIRDNVGTLETAIRTDFASAPEEALDPLVTSLLALSGLIHESMIRGYGWRFIEIGRHLERSYQSMSLIGALLSPVLSEHDEDSTLETVLLTMETLVTYRRRYRARTDIVNGLELTLLDDTNPRSLNSLLHKLNEHIDALPARQRKNFLTKEQRITLELVNDIQLAQPGELCFYEKGETARENLSELMDRGKNQLNSLATVLSDVYFDHTETYHQVSETAWEDEL